MKVFFITFFCAFSLFLCAQDGGKKSVPVSVKTFDESIDPLKVTIEVLDNETKEVIKTLESSGGGDARINLETDKSYVLVFNKPGYLFQSVSVSVPDSVSVNEKKLKDIVMQKVALNKKTVLNNIAFDVYQKVLIEESLPDIDRIIKLLEDVPQLQVEFGGYTDNIGSVSLNKKLSEERVKALVDMFVSKGVDEMRLQYKGYGSAQPIASNFTEEGRMMNNRVELKVIGLSFVPLSPAELKKKKAAAKKTDDPENPDQPVDDSTEPKDTIKTDPVPLVVVPTQPVSDTLLKIDFKGMFIADKKPMANSTVNLLTDEGQIYQTTKTDENGGFQFVGVPAEKELKVGLDEKEAKKFKTVQLLDTAGVIIEDIVKVNGKFEHKLLPSEKVKLGTVYVADPELRSRRPKSKSSNQTAKVTGRVLDDRGNAIKADVEVVDYMTGTVVQKINSSNSTGDFSVAVPVGKTYDIAFSKQGYSFQTVNAFIPDVAGYEKKIGDVFLQKVEAGKKIVLNNIFFDVNQSSLRKESYAELGRALKLMNDLPSLQIEISGHTDNIGSAKSNKSLSEQRAKEVVNYMIEKGINKSRLTYKGYGSLQPIANNNTETGRQMNRRTEFKVLQIDAAEVNSQSGNTTGNTDTQDVTISNDTPDSKEMPLAFKKYDLDKNGVISYEEVIGAIDLYFEEHPTGNAKKKEELTNLFDYYFEK